MSAILDPIYTLCRGIGQADLEFHSLAGLAGAIVDARDKLGADDAGAPAEIILKGAALHRGACGLEGACISVRARVTRLGAAPGELIGWAFLPDIPYVTQTAINRLMDAILAAAVNRAARAQRVARAA